MKKDTSQKPIGLVKSTFISEADTRRKLAQFVRSAPILSMGEQTSLFETSFAKKQGRDHAVFVNSGSSANLILVQALLNLGKLKQNDHVGISSITWATNVMPIIQLGLIPVAIDTSLQTLNVSPSTLAKQHATTPLKALFLTNALGFCDNMNEIVRFCKKNKILLIEDNCESLGSVVNGKLLGNFGLASTFSFFVAHHLSTIEGGMVVTDDDTLHQELVKVRAHGWDRNLSSRSQKKLRKIHHVDPFFAKYSFYDLAYNVRSTDIHAYLGNIQLPYWDTIVTNRAKNFSQFEIAMRKNPELIVPEVGHMDIVSNFAMPIIAKDVKLFTKYRKRFQDNMVEIRPIIAGNIADQPFYKKYSSQSPENSNARFIHERGFYFTNSPELTVSEKSRLVSLLQP